MFVKNQITVTVALMPSRRAKKDRATRCAVKIVLLIKVIKRY